MAPRAVSAIRNSSKLESFLHGEAQRMGATDEHPGVTEARIHEFASRLSPEELPRLAAVALDPAGIADERYLAIYVLGRASDPVTVSLLGQVAQAALPDQADNDALMDTEVLVRSLAIELLGEKADRVLAERALAAVARDFSNPFLQMRARSALEALRSGRTNALRERDESLLRSSR